MILKETELRKMIRDLLFEEVLGEPDQSREEDRDDPDDKDDDSEEDDVLQDTGSKDEFNSVGGVGLTGPMTPLGTGPDGGKGGPASSPSYYLQGGKPKKKKKGKKAKKNK